MVNQYINPIAKHAREVAEYAAEHLRLDAAARQAEDVAAHFAGLAKVERDKADKTKSLLVEAQAALAAAQAAGPASL